ncbi:hypothetical protein ACHAXT_010370 [Thalassiosira profunda]
MASVAALLRRAPAARRSLLRRRHGALAAASTVDAASPINSRDICTLSARIHPRHHPHPLQHHAAPFSSLAEDYDDDDDLPRGGGSGGGGSSSPPKSSSPLLPTRHSRNLPPPVCPPSHLRAEVEALFDAPVGSLIVYHAASGGSELKSAEEEVREAYYASDVAVQRAEYVMRGLNAMVSKESFVSRSLKQGAMEYDGEDSSANSGDDMAREDCFRAMLDLLTRMTGEGEAYEELRTRVRSQLMDPNGAEGKAAGESGYDSSSSSSSDSDSSSDEEGEGKGGVDGRDDDDSFDEWTEAMDRNMKHLGFNKHKAETSTAEEKDVKEVEEEDSPELYQFGANPGTTVHLYDLVLDALACLCQEQYGKGDKSASSTVDLVDLMPESAGSPPELAKDMLDVVLHRHWIDGGDVGLGPGSGGFNGVGQGIGVGAGTGAGALANASPFDLNYDVRTCPTPMTFNAVLRIAANFDPAAHAEAVENAKILSGSMGNAVGGGGDLKGEQERLRDVTLDAAMSTYSRMQMCSALTLRSLKASTKRATSRAALKRQFRLLDENYAKHKVGVISGRNGATYAYLLQTLANCVPPSLSRGNMAFALYHKGCADEGVLTERLVEAMGGVSGYEYDEQGAVVAKGEEGAPAVGNGPIFDNFMQKELGAGLGPAIEKGQKARHDRNSRLRRHVEWDDTY